jgi:phosphosulfolactate synthase (CoM biosynthesis protein A)
MIMTQSPAKDSDRAFGFLRTNARPPKPRVRGVTEIRGPYYTPMGQRYLKDVLETMGVYVDALKFAGGSFSLMPRKVLSELLELCHAHNVVVSTGGFIEHVLALESEAVHRYFQECKEVGFDIIEVSSGFITIPTDDWLRVIEQVQKGRVESQTGSGDSIRRRRRDGSSGVGSGRHAQPRVADRSSEAVPGAGQCNRRRRRPEAAIQ